MLRADAGRIAFYVERAHGRSPPTALGLGCGDGLLALSLVRAGLAVRAFDPSQAAVARAREAARAAGVGPDRLRIEQADVRALRLPERFGVAWAAGDELPVLADADALGALLSTARAHLVPGGVLVADLALVPDAGPAPARRRARGPRPHLRRAGGAIQRLEGYWPTWAVLEAALAEAGLTALEAWSGFDGEPFEPGGAQVAIVCEKAGE